MSEVRRRAPPASTDDPQDSAPTSGTDRTQKVEPRQWSLFNRLLLLLILLVLLLTTVLLLWHFLLRKPARPPHVVLLIADDLGWADVGWHSSGVPSTAYLNTPTLTGLAREGLILSQFYTQPICTASRAALLTGRYPFKLGLQGSRPILAGRVGGLPLGDTLLPQLLKTGGYRTHLIGKWHLGFEKVDYTPVMRGFDTFMGFYNGMQDYYTHTTSGFDTVEGVGGYDMRRDYLDPDGTPHIDNILWGLKGQYNNYIFTREATNLISDHAAHHAASPMFLVMSYPNPHSPIQVPEEYVQHGANSHLANKYRKTYGGLVYSMDCSVANITAALQEHGMYDDTIFIFMSDNGGTLTAINLNEMKSLPTGSSNYPLRGEKGGLWEGGSRVPAFISGKNVPKGKIDEMVHVTDMYPTLASYLGLDMGSVGQSLDGSDQSKLLKQETDKTAHEYFIYDIDPVYKQAAIRYGPWKLILGFPAANQVNGRYEPLSGNETSYNDTGLPLSEYVQLSYQLIDEYQAGEMCTTTECFRANSLNQPEVQLYDLEVDQYEFNDLAEQHPEIVTKLLGILDREMGDMIPPVNLLTEADKRASPARFNGTWMPWL